MNPTKSKTKRGVWLPVVAAIIKRENKVLLGQRPVGGSLAGLWEFPGGKIEMGELPEQALVRELREELNIEAELGPLRFATTHHYGDVGVLLLFYEVKYFKGQPETLQHTELRWVDINELKSMPMPEANKNVLERILPLLK